MKQYLDEYLKGKEASGFSPQPHYFEDGDYISVFFNAERCYAVSLNKFLTVYYSFDTDDLVGCKINGVRQLIQQTSKENK